MHHLPYALHRLVNAVAGHDGREEACYLVVALAEHVFMVEPYGFLVVELRTGLAALLDVELADQLVERKQLLLRARIPAKQREEVDYRLGEIALLAEAVAYFAGLGVVPFQGEYGETEAVAVTFAELALAVGLQEQRQMGEARHGVFPAEGAVQQHVQRRAGQPLLAAYYVGDFHQVVVHYVGEVICGQFVRALVEHLVVQNVALDYHVAAYHVVNVHLFARLHLEADHVLHAVGYERIDVGLRHSQRVAHLQARVGVILEVLYFPALGLKLLGSVEGDVGLARVEQLLHVLLVYGATLALAVRAVRAAEADALVELYAQPAERLDDVFLRPGNEARGVGVLYTEHHFAATLAREEVIVKRCAHPAYVERTRRTGRKAHPCFSFFHHFLSWQAVRDEQTSGQGQVDEQTSDGQTSPFLTISPSHFLAFP